MYIFLYQQPVEKDEDACVKSSSPHGWAFEGIQSFMRGIKAIGSGS